MDARWFADRVCVCVLMHCGGGFDRPSCWQLSLRTSAQAQLCASYAAHPRCASMAARRHQTTNKDKLVKHQRNNRDTMVIALPSVWAMHVVGARCLSA